MTSMYLQYQTFLYSNIYNIIFILAIFNNVNFQNKFVRFLFRKNYVNQVISLHIKWHGRKFDKIFLKFRVICSKY